MNVLWDGIFMPSMSLSEEVCGETTPSDEELHRGIVYLSAWTSVAVYYLWQAKALKRKQWRSLRFFCVHWIETENNYTLLFINKKQIKSMKTTLKFAALLLCFFGLMSCSNPSSEHATVNVTVTKSSQPVSGETVYYFRSQIYNLYGYDKFFAEKQQVITNSEDVATFTLGESQLDFAMSDQESFYFATFDKDDNVTGNTALTIRKGETKDITIKQ